MISLVAGSHADEPVGPLNLWALIRTLPGNSQVFYMTQEGECLTDLQEISDHLDFFLGISGDKFKSFLDQQTQAWRILIDSLEIPKAQAWVICPHLNPKGAEKNKFWWKKYLTTQLSHDFNTKASLFALVDYLKGKERELPGQDIEFGYPHLSECEGPRPKDCRVEPWELFKIWNEYDLNEVNQPHFHISLHGMGYSAGPWFLVEKSWDDQQLLESFKENLASQVLVDGRSLHDVERQGEKGFWRLGKGFCSRPDSVAMRDHFIALKDDMTASLFRPSSMEAFRSLYPRSFTAVSEMPLFILPEVGKHLGPPDAKAEFFKTKLSEWKLQLSLGDSKFDQIVLDDAWSEGIRLMSLSAQLKYQRDLFKQSYLTTLPI